MKLLMVRPTYFNVNYAINPHMLDSEGKLNEIDVDLAKRQWDELLKAYQKIGIEVSIIEGVKKLPDMVFSANHGLPVTFKKEIVLSCMTHPDRKNEIRYFKSWYENANYKVHENLINSNIAFEGMGDAIWPPNKEVLFGGWGFRTDFKAYQEIEKILDIKIVTLKLINESFYHLDTCFAILNDQTVAIFEDAFDEESLIKIKNHFHKIIKIDLYEATSCFAGNCFSPDSKYVFLNTGSPKFCAHLVDNGFKPVEVDTSEFIKAGGSVFCMKMVLED